MIKHKNWTRLVAVLGVAVFADCAQAGSIQITEWMYNGLGSGSIGEFVELTNTSNAAVNMSGWSFDDNTRTPGSTSLSGFGIVAPGQSVILTDMTAAAFITNWSLPSSVKVIGGNTDNLGRGDEINIYSNTNSLDDRLTYNDQTSGGGPRTSGVSGRPTTAAALGANNPALWTLSTVNDVDGAYKSAAGEIGSPGKSSYAPTVPLPAAAWLMLSGLGALGSAVRRRKRPV